MSIFLTVAAFIGYLILSIIGSFVMAEGVDKIGARLHLASGLFGLVTALGANTPEISSAIFALTGGHHELGFSVVFGSNIFNLAALLGLSAVIAGGIRISPARLLLNSLTAIIILVAIVALLLGFLSPWLTIAISALGFLPYATLVGFREKQIQRFVPSGKFQDFLCTALNSGHDPTQENQAAASIRWPEMLSIVPALVTIVFASRGMVNSAIFLAKQWDLPDAIVGALILATLTGIPNVIAAVRLARRQRGTAVVSEALNSNTLNLLAGVCLPALVLGLGNLSPQTLLGMWWLVGMTAVTVALTRFQEHLGRLGGACLIGLYLIFVGLTIFR